MSEAVFTALSDGLFKPSELARGPWDPDAQHGGAPAALLMRAFEALTAADEDDLMIARVTYEFVRPVPLAQLEVRSELVRPGRRAQLLEGTVARADGEVVVRARALRVKQTDVEGEHVAERVPAAGPDAGWQADFPTTTGPLFSVDAMDIRFVSGAFLETGPASAWFRLRAPLVAGEQPTPLQHLAAAADFGNGISAAVSWQDHLFINPDLTVYIEREPLGEWICLDSVTRVRPGGIGVAESVIYDEEGRVARALQALVVARR